LRSQSVFMSCNAATDRDVPSFGAFFFGSYFGA
jgi:hypothetical protein